MEKMANGLQKKKQAPPPKGEKRHFTWREKLHSFVVSRGGRVSAYSCPLLRAPMSECDYIKCTMFPEIIHHIIISKYNLECTQVNFFFKIFSEKHTLESSSNKIEQGYTHRTIDNASEMYYNTSPLAQKFCLNIDFYP